MNRDPRIFPSNYTGRWKNATVVPKNPSARRYGGFRDLGQKPWNLESSLLRPGVSLWVFSSAAMKRQRSYGEDVDAVGDRGFVKDWGRRDQDLDRPTSHRRFYPKSDTVRRGYYDRVLDEDRDLGRVTRKRFDKEAADGFDRRKGFERYERMLPVSSPRGAYCGPEKVYRSDSFPRREFPKGFRSGRDPPRRKENVSSSWRRPAARFGKDGNEEAKRGRSEDRGSSKSSAGSRDVGKSPPWSKDSVGEQSKDVGKSPPWSKDSVGEQSKSVETEKTEEANEESNRGNEMEEGELQPDPQPLSEQELQKEEAEPAECLTESVMDMEAKMDVVPKAEASDEEKLDLGGKEEEDEMLETMAGASEVEEGKKLSDDQEVDDVVKSCEMEGDAEVEREREERGENIEGGSPDSPSPNHESESQTEEDMNAELATEKPPPLEEEQQKERNVMGVRTEVEGTSLPSSSKAVEEHAIPEALPRYSMDDLNDKRKDKGKGLAVSPSDEGDSVDVGAWVTRDLFPVRDDAMEGPSCRSYQRFESDLMRNVNTNNSNAAERDENLRMEPLELSLGLPGVSKASDSHCAAPAPSSPKRARNSTSHGRSVHSLPTTYRTGSDGFTASISFSGSQTLMHNPSCSLTQNSLENYEQSVGSRPIFQGFDRVPQGGGHGESSNEPKRKDISFSQWTLQNGKAALLSSQAIQGKLNSNSVLQISSGATGIPDGMDQHRILSRQSSGQLRQDDAKSPACSIGSYETRSEHSKHGRQKLKERTNSGQLMIGGKEMRQWVLSDRAGFERIISDIALEPIHTAAKRIEAMTNQSIAYLKESICDLIKDAVKQEKLQALQKALQRRSDLTFETLSNCDRTHLEILLVIKTGLTDFLRQTTNIQSSDLIEIFLNLKCRNLQCGNALPVDECDCKVCVQMNGFCNACMCLVCSKFDLASNTCSWVGCDLCLHWCHADCGLRNHHIKNGRSIMGTQGVNEMQFHCIACGHPSEMFGFVKEVFKTCAKEWKAETFSKELEYVRRIFSASDDAWGKKLHDVAVQMLMKLQHDPNIAEVYDTIMVFLNESDSKYSNNPSALELSPKNPGEGSNRIAVTSQETAWLGPASAEKAPAIENSGSITRRLDWDQLGGQVGFQGLQKKADKRPVMDELDTIVRIKEAEAEMFQARADAARSEAESLKCISKAKNEKIEQDYANRISKLSLAEAEARRKRKLEELQALEKANLEYSNMKTRMEADIKNLMLQMETTKRNLGT
ncbi:hypothetical protein ACLOJK_016092 [Asimina triloba]